jgi:RsmE family RNA methyltransferase
MEGEKRLTVVDGGGVSREVNFPLSMPCKERGLEGEVNLFIGPEGGFGPQDLEFFEKNDFLFWNLNQPILRSENAGGIAISLLLNNQLVQTP